MAENCTRHAAQPLHAAGRAGPRRARVEQVPRRVDRALRRPTPTWCSRATTGPGSGPRVGAATTCEKQRDTYRFLHDQTMRLANHGLHDGRDRRGARAPARARRPSSHVRGYYGTREPQRQGRVPALPRLVRRQPGQPAPAAAGGGRRRATSSSWAAPTRCSSRARTSFDAGDYRWVAQVVNHVVFAEPDNADGPRAAGRRARAARLPGRVGSVAQLLPHRRPGAALRRAEPGRRLDREHRRAPGDDGRDAPGPARRPARRPAARRAQRSP